MAESVYDIAVVGGGASGMMAAVEAARAGARVVLLEAQQRAGRKLLASGNGRCNLTNRLLTAQNYHGDAGTAAHVWERWTPELVIREFRRFGLLCRELEEGRVYPYSLQASTVQKLLLRLLENTGAELHCGFLAENITRKEKGFTIASPSERLLAQRVIIAAGGKAAPQLGGGESGYELARALGHTVTPLFPALVQLAVPRARVKALKGARALAAASLLVDGRVRKTVRGEVLFAEAALSGICIFELSRVYGALSEQEQKNACVRLDLMPEYEIGDIKQLLKGARGTAFHGAEAAEGLLNRLIAPELARRVLPKQQGTTEQELNPRQLSQLAAAVKQFDFPVTGTLGWEHAQVTAGGIPLAEIDENTMESRCCPGVYFTGEILNIDGDCGGFNLHWAWSTGIIAGRAAALKNREDVCTESQK